MAPRDALSSSRALVAAGILFCGALCGLSMLSEHAGGSEARPSALIELKVGQSAHPVCPLGSQEWRRRRMTQHSFRYVMRAGHSSSSLALPNPSNFRQCHGMGRVGCAQTGIGDCVPRLVRNLTRSRTPPIMVSWGFHTLRGRSHGGLGGCRSAIICTAPTRTTAFRWCQPTTWSRVCAPARTQ